MFGCWAKKLLTAENAENPAELAEKALVFEQMTLAV